MPSSEAVVHFSESSIQTITYLKDSQSAGHLNPGFLVDYPTFNSVKFHNHFEYQDSLSDFINTLINTPDEELSSFGFLLQTGQKTINSRDLVPLLLKYYNLYDTVVFRQQTQYGTLNTNLKPSFAQQTWEDLVLPEHTLLNLYQSFKSKEYLHKRIFGSKSSKEDTSFESRLQMKLDGRLFLHSPISFHPTRTYHEYIYSLPYELRSCLYPQDSEHQFYYLDLHAAELCFYANLAHEDSLVDWINSGKSYDIDGSSVHFDFWRSLCYEIGFSYEQLNNPDTFNLVKPIVKKNVYSILYSLSHNSMLPFPVTPDNPKGIHSGQPFMMWFLNKAPRLRGLLLNIRFQSSTTHKIQLWEGTEFDLSNHHNQLPAMLNYTAQAGLSQLTNRVIANLLFNGYLVYTFNFDSILISAKPDSQESICSIINSTYQKHGFKFNYKVTTGPNYDTAQNHGEVVYPIK